MTALLALLLCAPTLAQDGAEISRSRGKDGGVVVLWPRVVPATEDAEVLAAASSLHARLTDLAMSVAPEATDPRPRPERVCPGSGGCRAVSLSAVLAHQGGGCAVVALVGAPGESAVKLIPWAADVVLAAEAAAFRTPPENQLTIEDFALCDALDGPLEEGGPAVTEAVRSALQP